MIKEHLECAVCHIKEDNKIYFVQPFYGPYRYSWLCWNCEEKVYKSRLYRFRCSLSYHLDKIDWIIVFILLPFYDIYKKLRKK